MAVEKMTENVEVVQTLSTYPNQEEGLSAEQLKAKFDQGPKALKEYLNNVLVPAVQAIQNAMDAGAQYGLDTTLSVPGRAADAGAVGTALAGKAPAGYGLGEKYSRWANTLDEITSNGFYSVWLDTANGDPTTGNSVFHAVVNGNYNNVHLSGKVGGGYLHRDKWDGVWQPWEWVNPPMQVGVEYRTTERWNGKAVYTKMLDCGNVPNASRKDVFHGISNCTPIDYSGTLLTAEQCAVANGNISIIFTASAIVMQTTIDISDCTLMLKLKYTKD